MRPHLRFLALIPIILAAGCGFGKTEDPEKGAKKGEEVLLVRTVRPEARDLDRVVEISAEVAAILQGDVSARVQGVRVEAVLKDVGDAVAAGDLLARLEDVDLRQAADEAALAERTAAVKVREADLSIKELESELSGHQKTIERRTQAYDRARAQAERGAVAEEDLEAARFELDKESSHAERLKLQIDKARVTKEMAEKDAEKAALAVRKARTDLANVEVRAPFAGVVCKRTASPGQLTGSGQTLFQVFSPESLVAQAWLPQRDLRHIRLGQAARLASDAVPGVTLFANVSLISPTVEDGNGTVLVRLAFDRAATLADAANQAAIGASDPESLKGAIRAHPALHPGLFLSGKIVIETRRGVLTVPRKAVGYQSGRPFVFVTEPLPPEDAASASPPATTASTDPPAQATPKHRVRRYWFQEGLAAEGIVEFVPVSPDRKLKPEDSVVEVGGDRLRDGDPVLVEAPSAVAAEAPAATTDPAPPPETPSGSGGNGKD